ncbi:MAG: tetratricopeptide repeat protein, partial [Thermodesulfobacteriota bacterium]
LTAAITAYERALPLLPDDGDLLFNLAIAYDKSGQAAEALRSWNLALRLAPDDVELRYNLALFHKRAGDDEAALSQLEEVVRREPGYAPAYGHLATLSLRRGQASQAMCCYERLLELGHDVEAARHMLAALRGERLEKAATGYVRKLFDGYAETFEQELVERLGYDAPARLRFLVERSLPAGRRFGRLLDLGCGTGLVGEAFRDLAATLVGVDLSGRMVAVARDKGIYDELEVDEAVAFCRRQERRFDAIVAADVLVYLGELGSFFAALAAALLPGGLVAFSTERAAAGFTLRPSGRYAHAPDYVAETAIACGLRLLVREETRLRQEQGQWLVGDLFILALAG